MALELSNFYTELMDDVAARAGARGQYRRTALLDELVQRLIQAEELQDWLPAFFDGRGYRRRLIGLDGYSTDELELDGTLHVVVAELKEGTNIPSLVTGDVKAAFARATSFVDDAMHGRLSESLEPSHPAAELARLLEQNRKRLTTLRVHVLSNANLGSRIKEIDRDVIPNLKVELNVWDLMRFYQLAEAGGREEVDIDLTSFVAEGLPVLPAGIGETGYAAYLCVVPGSLLADIYEQHGTRLLEGNVRAFLSTSGNVNKGIRRTITTSPAKFFAFNNGITATATGAVVVSTDAGVRLKRVRDLQIVNGGQTTASLFNARVRDKVTLDGVYVQMKLSVLPSDVAEAMIPEISQFANTQNKVSDADLFANHPFHRKVEELSRRIWAPPRPGTHQMTHWFYERARAQYQTEQMKLRPPEKREFLIHNPKDQVITKTDLAKYENTWLKRPHIVSLGAQKNFVRYAEAVRDHYIKHPADFNEHWFHHVVAKALLFKTAERLVSAASWYTGGYRANIVTYGIARLVKLIEDGYPGHMLDLDRIWKTQHVSEATSEQILLCAEAAFKVLTSPPAHWSNVTEWAKKDQCWLAVAHQDVPLLPALRADLKTIDDENAAVRNARTVEKAEVALNSTMEVVRLAAEGYWARAAASPACRRVLTEVEFGILQKAAQEVGWVPSDRQATRLMAAKRRLDQEGIT